MKKQIQSLEKVIIELKAEVEYLKDELEINTVGIDTLFELLEDEGLIKIERLNWQTNKDN